MNKRNLAITAFAVSTALFSATSASAETDATDEKDILILSGDDFDYPSPPPIWPSPCKISGGDAAEYTGPDRHEQTLDLDQPLEFEVDGENLTKISIEHLETLMSFASFDPIGSDPIPYPKNFGDMVYIGDQLELSDFSVTAHETVAATRGYQIQTESDGLNVQMIELDNETGLFKFESDTSLLTNHSQTPFHRAASYKTHLKVKCYTN